MCSQAEAVAIHCEGELQSPKADKDVSTHMCNISREPEVQSASGLWRVRPHSSRAVQRLHKAILVIGNTLLALLPLASLIGFWVILLASFPESGWRRAGLRAALACGAYMLLATEVLSLFRAITPGGLGIAWALPILGEALWWVLRGRQGLAT